MLPRRAATLVFCSVLMLLASAEPVAPQTVLLPMRDGAKLATDLYLPATQGTFPVILGRTPYHKATSANFGRDGAQRGYVVVIQDTRGRFGSEGENLPFHLDVPDGADTLAWIAQHPWCNGRIGTWGGSAGAITQFQLAAAEPTKLASQHLVVGAPNLYEVIYIGGIFRKALIEGWIRVNKFQDDAVARWVAHPTYDRHWRDCDATRHYRAVNAAGLHIGGYWDIFAQSTIDAFVGDQTQGGPGARGMQKLLLGPWTHGVLQDKAGELTFPNAKRPPNNVQDQWRWFAATLKGKANGVAELPAVTYYVVGDVSDTNAPGNVWRTATVWPPFAVTPTKLHLHGDRSLRAPKPGNVATLSYRYEVQVLDSFGQAAPGSGDCGGLYSSCSSEPKCYPGKAPPPGLSRAPGEWQSLDVIFRAPRFGAAGRKTANARFVEARHNGRVIHENADATCPTCAATYNDERPTGPLKLQGDHGPVAFRNLRIRPVNLP